MKRLVLIFVLIFSCLFFISCNQTECDGCFGNKTTFDFTMTYENAYIKVGEEWMTVEVKQWNDYEGEQIQLVLKDGTVLLLHSSNCILYSGTLPIA